MCYVADNVESAIAHSESRISPHQLFKRTLAEALRNYGNHQKKTQKTKPNSCSSWWMLVQMPVVVLGLQMNNFLAEFRSGLPKPSGRGGEDAQLKAVGSC